MYASIYLDAATSAVFVSKITAVDAGGTYIEVSKTANKLGTAPTAGATGRSCKVGGAWGDFAALVSSLFTAQTVDQSTRINIKAGTYSNGNNNRILNLTGTATNPVWYRGYNTTPGDLDDYSSLTKPVISCSGNSSQYYVNRSYNTLTGLDFTGNAAAAIVILNDQVTLHRCRVTNTNANSASVALSILNPYCTLTFCRFVSTSSANVVSLTGNQAVFIYGCVFTGGIAGILNPGNGSSFIVVKCVFRSLSGSGISCSNVTAMPVMFVQDCTFYGCGSDAINIAGPATTNRAWIINCNFWSITGYGINAAGGTQGYIFRAGNDFGSCSSGAENGFGDSPGAPGVSGASFGSQNETSNPWTSTTDMTPRVDSLAHQMALPRTFEYEPYNTYADVGAVNSQDTPIPMIGGHVARRT